MEYEVAIKKDKRTYFQYYISLLKKKHIILFTFLPIDDYNLKILKISLFIILLSLYFSLNAFFFSDSTMHKIYIENGSFSILAQIPQIIYSTVISTFIGIIFKKLSLSEKTLLFLKQQKNTKEILMQTQHIKCCLKIRFLIFYFFLFIFIFFFWYFISCFCAVYKNTQFILIKDSIVSFGITFVYPFVLYLLPGLFRIPSLKANKKNKKCIYKIGNIIFYF